MFPYKKIFLFILSCYSFLPASAFAEGPKSDTQNKLDDVVVTGKRFTQDQKGEADIYRKNGANAYLSKEYLERYKINSAGDVLKGLNGVYNMNSRTAGSAITPNIRGITGKGRVPVTIDGTEQTIDVWLNNYGVGDRNYLDPALFRSIAVDKSPDIFKGRKTGVGGSVVIRTLEAEDIILEGKKWGIQLKTDFSNNAVKPQQDFSRYLGWEDYRTLPGGATADGAGGGLDMVTGEQSPVALQIYDVAKPRMKSGSNNTKFSGDKAVMLAGAFKTDVVDGLVAYSYRDKGNYFSGKKGAEGYLDNPIYDGGGDCKDAEKCVPSTSFIPNMAKMYKPGEEVLNSNTETTTWLAKNNWYLPNNQKISLQYMQNDIGFGELNPFQSMFLLKFSEANPFYGDKAPIIQTQNIDSHIKSKTYKVGYEWNPEDNQWINLKANLWRVKTNSIRHQSGGMSLGVYAQDIFYDTWYSCNVRKEFPQHLSDVGQNCAELGEAYGFNSQTTQEEMIKNSPLSELGKEGAFRVVSGAKQKTQVTRDGIDISNTFIVNDRFKFSIGADYQKEKLDENVMLVNGKDLFNFLGILTNVAKMSGPRAGRRQEWGINTSFDWQITDKLNFQAGIRYQNFWAYDDALAEGRRQKNSRYAFGGDIGYEGYYSGIIVPYYELMKGSELTDFKKVQRAFDIADEENYTDENIIERDRLIKEYKEKYGNPYAVSTINAQGERIAYFMGTKDTEYDAYYRLNTDYYIPFKNGKLDVAAGKTLDPKLLEQRVNNPQGKTGSFYQYLAGEPFTSGGRINNGKTYQQALEEPYGPSYANNSPSNVGGGGIGPVEKTISEEERWQAPKKIKNHAWSPMFALTYDLTDTQRIFARYAKMTRFPSIYEITASSDDGLFKYPTTPGLDLKPERSTNWEIGYNFNFAAYFPALRAGDVRLTYYSNTIKNVIDTTESKRITQYDKKINKGIELQARIDSGRFFAALGGSYRLKQEMCDQGIALINDLYLHRAPECVEGGYGTTRFYQALQPKYSINLDIGTRLLGEKLELGMRGVYHSAVKNKQYDRLVKQGYRDMFYNMGSNPYYWRPSLVLDMYGRYAITKNITVNLAIGNITNRYYLDPMSNVAVPGPGRTVTLGISGKF